MRLQLLFASAVLVGCGGMVAEVEDGGRDASTSDGVASDAGFSVDTAPPVLDTAVPPSDAPSPRGSFFVNEVSPATGKHDIAVTSDCSVTRDGKELGRVGDAACAEFWRAVYDVAAGMAGPCPAPTDGYRYTLQLNSTLGPTYWKTEKDYCLRSLPGIAAHKGAYALVYALGGK